MRPRLLVVFLHGDLTVDALADIRIWGKGAQEAWEHFDAPRLPTALELQRFVGGRAAGQVYPVTLEDVDGRAALRWSIPPIEVED